MPLLYTKQGHTGILTLSRPEARNCWGQDYADGLIRYLDEAAEDDEVRSVILTGDEAGGAFSAGANLRDPKTHNTRSAEAFIKRVGRARNFPSNLVSDFPKPVIAAVNGYAIGIGCIVTFCCDLIVASERAEWRLPQVALGILPNYGGATRLARIVGKGLAMRVAMGFPLKADEAHRPRPVAGAARRADGPGHGGRRPHRRTAAAGRTYGQGVDEPRTGHPQHRGRFPGRRLPLHGAGDERGQGRGA
jgi:enoyl-CoA hydratase/carnithine racemase